MISPRRLSSPSGLDAAWRADFNALRLTLCNGSLNIHRARSLRWAKRFRDWRPPSLDYGKGRRADRRRVECLLNFIMSASDQAAITYYSTVAERQQKTAKLRASCGSSGIEIRVSPSGHLRGLFLCDSRSRPFDHRGNESGPEPGTGHEGCHARLARLRHPLTHCLYQPTKRSAY